MSQASIILVEDDKELRESLSEILELNGFRVNAFPSADKALPCISYGCDATIVSDIRMPNMDGVTFLEHIRQIDEEIPVILISGHADIETALQCIKLGAFDFVEKPLRPEHLIGLVTKASQHRQLTLENRRLKQSSRRQISLDEVLLGQSEAMVKLKQRLITLANADVNIVINGETGTGKELVARSLHEQSWRRDQNFVAINCGAIPESLLDSELFGHEAGTFTGAKAQRIGKFEHANNGTLFLDEIESMALTTQAPLLRVLQERSIERLGSNQLIPLDFRVVAATKVDLKDAAEKKEFRQDLYYRLNVVTLEIPPLRDRREDIPLLFQHFVLVAAARCETEVPSLNSKALHALMGHDWPGNIRELRNIAERYVLLGDSYNFDMAALMNSDEKPAGLSLSDQVAGFEKVLIEQALNRKKGNIKQVMEVLDIPRKTLSDKMKKYGLERQRYK